MNEDRTTPGLTLLTPRRLTTAEVQDATFTRARIGGISEPEVRAFLDRVADELAVLASERDTAQEQLARMQAATAAQRQDAGAPGPDHVHSVSVLQTAQRTADKLRADAELAAAQITEAARRERDKMLGTAEEKAAELLHRTEAEAATVRAQAPAEARVRLARWHAMGQSLSGQLSAVQEALAEVTGFWGEQPPEPEPRPARRGGRARQAPLS